MNPHLVHYRVVQLLDLWRCEKTPKAKLEAVIAIEQLGFIPRGLKKIFI